MTEQDSVNEFQFLYNQAGCNMKLYTNNKQNLLLNDLYSKSSNLQVN